MDALERLELAARKAREFEHVVDGTERRYTVRRPTVAEAIEVAARRNIDTKLGGGAGAWLWLRYQLEEAIVGWTGVRERDLVPGGTGGTAPLEWSPRAVRLLLDAMPPAEFEALARALQQRTEERNDAIEADAGN